jgi:hypothetical protein
MELWREKALHLAKWRPFIFAFGTFMLFTRSRCFNSKYWWRGQLVKQSHGCRGNIPEPDRAIFVPRNSQYTINSFAEHFSKARNCTNQNVASYLTNHAHQMSNCWQHNLTRKLQLQTQLEEDRAWWKQLQDSCHLWSASPEKLRQYVYLMTSSNALVL